ncbi:MAG: ATP-dependent DNA helicase, partial [Longimicrobiales bacterium]
YEDRTGQQRMLRFVATTFNDGGVGMVEAGTGTGKSLAYLVPAAKWALQNGERTVVSTNTINLQQQLVEKDLEIAESVVGERLNWALVKGRGNYVSIRRARLAAEAAPTLFPDDRTQELEAMLKWLDVTTDGSLTDLPFVPSIEVWEEARSETDACLRAKCPHFQECFYQRSRRNAAGADLVVVNHSLFFSDLAVRIATGNTKDGAVLPAYDRVIFDEAHHLEDAATPHLGAQVTRSGLFRVLARLDRGGKGVLASLDEGLRGLAMDGLGAVRERIEGQVRPKVDALRSELSLFFDALEPWVEERSSGEGIRLGTSSGLEPTHDAQIAASLEAVLIRLAECRRTLAGLRERLEIEEELGAALEGRLLDLASAERRMEAAAHGLRLGLVPEEQPDRTLVRWMELRRGSKRSPGNLVIAAAPVDLGSVLREHLFDETHASVLTSATMSARGSFDYLRGRLGLEPAAEALVPSPFDFEAQTLLVLPTDLPDPAAQASRGAFHEAAARVVHDTAQASGGGVFALFTSFGALRAVSKHLRSMGAEGRWTLFVQGEADRASLLRGFTEDGSGILLGTASFWEGVDVPGHPLRALVIHKIPFRVPTEPITAARLEAIEERGQSSFWEYMVPNAAIRLKQGVGRLIRSKSDRGVVVILDDRLVRKRYGRVLRDSLPPMPMVKGAWDDVRRRVIDFY